MARTAYILDGAVLGEEAAYGTEAVSYNVTTLGFLNKVEVVIEDEVKQVKSIKGGASGHEYDRNVDLIHKVTGTIEFMPVDFKYMKYVLGNYAATSTYTVASQTSLPTTLSMKGNYDGTKALKVLGLVFTKVTAKISEGNMFVVTAQFQAKKESAITESITYTPPSEDPITYLNGTFTYNSKAYKINDLSVDMDLGAIFKRNVESVSAGDERVYTEVVRTIFKPTVNGTADLQASADEYEEYTGGTSVQAARSDVNLVLTLTDAGGDTHTLTVSGFRPNKFNKILSGGEEDSIKTFTFSGVALDIACAGTV